jgi:hypothetical protein
MDETTGVVGVKVIHLSQMLCQSAIPIRKEESSAPLPEHSRSSLSHLWIAQREKTTSNRDLPKIRIEQRLIAHPDDIRCSRKNARSSALVSGVK